MSEYLDRKQVIDLYEKHHSHLATYVWEFGQELRQLPITTIPVAELDTTKEERPKSSWRFAKGRVGKAICEHCGMLSIVEPFGCPPYCQWCGADMRVKNELNRVSKELNMEE